jgi:hydroxylamine reductase
VSAADAVPFEARLYDPLLADDSALEDEAEPTAEDAVDAEETEEAEEETEQETNNSEEEEEMATQPIQNQKTELVADKAMVLNALVDLAKSGAIKKFVVMAGCDGRMKSRDYYSDFATQLPQDNVILTAGCAKYRYNKLPLGDIGGIPRVLDAGQCNDSYSLAVVALKLKEIFNANDINDLPIAYNIAWYEQKAVIVLLALLSLGVKNIHLGPTLPAFLSPNVANVLVNNFGIAGIGTVDEDMKLFLS